MNNIELNKFQRLCRQLRIPDNRITPLPANFRWILANAWIENRNNPKLDELLDLIRPYA
ncbi:MAG: hypothetical protein OEZ39_09045 [Gammaproteobacteria bacterium]|nr:hypothetical protein [Gammaproteobacteria bacterium]MDH5651999.1 hypothetical protein [Gammaproteobacteria bacterium]